MARPNTLLISNASAPPRSALGSEDPLLFSPATLAAAKTPTAPPAAMSISGEVPDEGSDGEEVFIDEQDIIQEIHLDEEDLPDHDDDDEDDEEDQEMDEVEDHSAYAFHGHTDEVFAAACSPVDASLVVSGGKDDRGFLWRIGSEQDFQELTGHGDTVCTVAFSSDGKLVACGSMDGQINVWDTATRTLQGTLEGSSGSGFEWLRWHPRGHLIIAGSEDCNVWMWNADHNAFLNTFAGHSSTVTCGDFTPDGKLICSGSDDATLRIWDPKSAQCRHVVRGHGYHTQGLTCLAITPDSQSIVSGSEDNSVHIVSINSGQVVGSLVGHTNSIECIGISSRYNWVATGSIDRTLIIWDLARQAIRSTCEHDEGVTCLAWLGSSRYVASGCIDGMVRIWDSLSGDLARMFSGHRDVVQSLAVSADGNSIVSVSTDKSARVFDISMFK
ncbi:unnamed protein product [Triticum turgidum subsp. durum]|uniref:Angio-associated migratory cell protein n=1 Tax=Triticum turgidum subsp. durum TaxID=4567 RepID=A0A9R1NL93_TRITD|nr:unnamed protein product [Triticum turgidum subsp. durum]